MRDLRCPRPPAVRGDPVHAAAVRPDRRLSGRDRAPLRGGRRRLARGRRRRAQPSLLRRLAPARRGLRRPGVRGRRVGRLQRDDRAPSRPRSAHARVLRHRQRGRRVRRGPAAERGQGRGRRAAQRERLAHHPRQLPDPAPRRRRHGGPGRGGQARGGALRRADPGARADHGAGRRRAPDGPRRAVAAQRDRQAARRYLRRRGVHRRLPRPPRPALLQPAHRRRGDRVGLGPARRPRRHGRAGRPADQHALRRHDRHRDPRDAALAAARHRPPRRRRHQRRPVPARHDLRPARNAHQPALPRAHDRALLPGEHRRRRGHARARAGPARGRGGRGRQPQGRRVLRRDRRRRMGLHGHPRGLLRRPLRQGRPGRRRHALRQHAQQPDRGHRVALPAPDPSLRAARRRRRQRPLAGRARLDPRDRVPRRRRVLARGRRQLDRAARPVRRRRGHPGLGDDEPGHAGRALAAVQAALYARDGGRGAAARRPVRGRLRRPGRARPRGARTRHGRRILGPAA